ncbi:MAG TPA: hypothetical protein DCY20_08460 [Firmicutes bacterium]|nr:hypothetical protein [Bacillota bacterium]
MISQLKQVYGPQCIIDEIPNHPNDYYWFTDDEHKMIGIKKSITVAEKKLLSIVFNEVGSVDFNQQISVYWTEILLKNQIQLLDKVVKSQKQVRFIFFTHLFDSETKLEFNGLIKELNEAAIVLFLERKYGVILDFSMSDEYSFEEMAEAIQQDFYQNINFYQTSTYEMNEEIALNFQREYRIYTRFRDPSVLVMDSHDMALQFMIHHLNEFEGYETIWQQFLALDHDLIEVAKCYIENNFNLSMGAKAMYMHRNTFMNKIERFIALTGLNIKEFKDAMIAYLMIKSIEQHTILEK